MTQGKPMTPTPTARPGSGAGDFVESLVPYKNSRALLSYYLGLFSIIPILGLALGVAAVVLGILGLRCVKQHPEARGKVHAWVGLITGLCFGLFNLTLTAAMIVGIVVSLAAHGRQ